MELTEKQKATLAFLADGPALISAPVAVRLIKTGHVERTGESGERGKSHVRLTDAGRAAL